MKVPRYLRLLAKPRSLDFERAFHDVVTTIRAPWKLLKDVQSRRNATGKMARDDPALHVLLSGLLALCGLAWGVTTKNFRTTIDLVFRAVFVDYLLFGSVIASLGFVSTNLLARRRDPLSVRLVEWSYFFDVHSNSFLVMIGYLYIGQLILLPVLNRSNWFSVVLSDLLYLVAAIHYCVISQLGYSLVGSEQIVQTTWVGIMAVHIVLFLGLVLSKTCMTKAVMAWYFPVARK